MVQANEDANIMYVILGEGNGKCMKTTKTSRLLPGGKFMDPWPIVVQVPDDECADEVLAFEPAIRLIKAAKTTEEQVRLSWTLPGANSILKEYVTAAPGRAFYPVVYGRKSAIFLTYNDAVSSVKAVEKAIWRRVATFGQAIGFMILRGESEKGVNGDYQELRDSLPAAPRPSQPEPVTSPPRGSSQPRPEPPTPVTPSRARQAVPANFGRWSNDAQDYMFETQALRAPPPSFPEVFDDPLFNQCVPELPVAPPALATGFVYQHVRSLQGIRSSHRYPVADTTPTPSCGPAVDAYLQAFGYDVNSRLTVARALQLASTMGQFVALMSEYGFAALEAKYLWDIMGRLNSAAKMAARREAARKQRRGSGQDAARKPWKQGRQGRQGEKRRRRTKSTPEDRAVAAQKRRENQTKYTVALKSALDAVSTEVDVLHTMFPKHSKSYYEREILQKSKLASHTRKTNDWNAFIRAKLREMNDALPSGAKKYTATHPYAKAVIKEAWNSMTDDEKAHVSVENRKDLEEAKEIKHTGKQNSTVAAFHDVRRTLNTLCDEFKRAHQRTGLEVGLVAVRTDPDHLNPPLTFATSDRVHKFLNLAYNTSLEEIAGRLEAYELSGLHGVLNKREDALQELQLRAATLITDKLRDITQNKAKKMFYTGFGEKITRRFRVVVVGWPLPELVRPSTIRSSTDLEVLCNAWENHTARFRKLTAPEYAAWKAQNPKSATREGDDDDEDNNEDNDGTGAVQQTATYPVNTVSGANGSAVAQQESAPRKRRSDYQGTHQSKKRRVDPERPESSMAPPPAVQTAGAVALESRSPTVTSPQPLMPPPSRPTSAAPLYTMSPAPPSRPGSVAGTPIARPSSVAAASLMGQPLSRPPSARPLSVRPPSVAGPSGSSLMGPPLLRPPSARPPSALGPYPGMGPQRPPSVASMAVMPQAPHPLSQGLAGNMLPSMARPSSATGSSHFISPSRAPSTAPGPSSMPMTPMSRPSSVAGTYPVLPPPYSLSAAGMSFMGPPPPRTPSVALPPIHMTARSPSPYIQPGSYIDGRDVLATMPNGIQASHAPDMLRAQAPLVNDPLGPDYMGSMPPQNLPPLPEYARSGPASYDFMHTSFQGTDFQQGSSMSPALFPQHFQGTHMTDHYLQHSASSPGTPYAGQQSPYLGNLMSGMSGRVVKPMPRKATRGPGGELDSM
ncbi:hypothetical protein OH76DRAFT_1498611 [Lentinus brumalis]|uniref:Uncharacterized protein n=1 Tax=Lentinus brumalis TaxID=2498619 RepID=A0A371CNZ3_9APHY|nr:hypothetical protein OH76DRAFT_1498611 [Polyporus brumalis]